MDELCLGFGVLIVLLVTIYYIFLTTPFRYKKKTGKGETVLTIEAKKDLAKVIVYANDVTFERSRIKEGRTIEFDFPPSRNPIKITVVEKSGRIRKVEI